ncbi:MULTISPECIES: DUF4350 domain-containing protein [Brevundimonas]|uniref:DUF4350 domain-containing protein n=1 Tax=Brevundimonas TaxID=41275 RepID=UPI001F35361B|nr:MULTISPECIES: DUF4350 domain-containing protein [Brevundimonas]MDA0743247.1 DUF4350 domain-containing protein [Pseudomonadota bacterium]MDM8353041.1 DUF4350 domain-containing protein [Brevundimonas diminuta]
MSRSAKAAGNAFSPVVIISVLLVSVVALAGLGVLSAYAPELKSGDDGGGHALSRSSTGFGAMPVLLRNLGVPVTMSRGRLTPSSDESLLVLTPTPSTQPEQIDDINHAGATLIVLPKWNATPDPKHPGWVRTMGLLPAQTSLAPLSEHLRQGARLQSRDGRVTVALKRPDGTPLGAPVDVDALKTLSGPDWVPVVTDDQDRPVLARHATTRVYVLADADLLSTHGLKALNGARTAVALLDVVRAEDAPVVFDLTLHGMQRTRSLLRLMLEPPLLGMTLVLAALAAFAGYQAVVRFGPARESGRAIALGKRGLADNTAGLVRLARREHHMAAPYALLTRAAVARAIGAPRRLSESELDAFLDRVSRTTGAHSTYSALADQARAAKTPGDLMRVAVALYRWNQELTRARQ